MGPRGTFALVESLDRNIYDVPSRSRTSICNNVRRVGSSSPPRRYFRTGLLLGLARDIARSFVARFQNHSVWGGRHSAST
jgi:hypothetical protein